MKNDDKTILNFDSLRAANMSRVARWHPLESWTPEQWLLAACGEIGEAANALKKAWRAEAGIANISDADRQINSYEEAKQKIADEIADTIVYLDLTAARMDINLADAIRRVFNRTSVKYGFPERIGEHSLYLERSTTDALKEARDAILSTAQALSPEQQEEIRAAFATLNRYGVSVEKVNANA